LEEIVTVQVFIRDPRWSGPFLRHNAALLQLRQRQITFENKQLPAVPCAIVGHM
jgi:hypothetical protein